MPDIPIINVNLPKPENLVWGDNYSSKKDKRKLYKILAYIAIISALIIFFRFAFLAYLYISNLPKINDYDANIETIALSEDGKTAYIKLSGGNQKEIDSIKFIFKSNETEYIYETKEGIKEISYEKTNSFLSYFAHPEYKGSYDYSIKADDIGLSDFKGIIKVEVSIKFKDEAGNIKETKTIDTSNKADIKIISRSGFSGGSGGGSSGGGSGRSSGSNPSCTPNCQGKTCGTDGCSGTCGICGSAFDCINSNCILVDPIFPLFSNYYDNTYSLNISGIAKFNITISNSNKSIFLRINNQNYQANNLSENNYYVSINLLSGIYSYYWFSYGNGTRNNFNQSKEKTYVVNGSRVGINSCGFYYYPSPTYLYLTQNISSDKTCLFLYGNITLDLNGYSVKFLDANYSHVNNYNFEDWTWNGAKYILNSWDTTQAPNLQRKTYLYDRALIGDYSIYLNSNETIISNWVYLPVGNRSYRGMVLAVPDGPLVNISVENSSGATVCSLKASNGNGGGILSCNFKINNPGNFRLKISADSPVYLDYADINPAYDAGIISAENINDYYCNGYQLRHFGTSGCTAPDYVGIYSGIYKSNSNLKIMNGTIESNFPSFRGFGLLKAHPGELIIDKINIKTQGVMTRNIVTGYKSIITNSKFSNHMPWTAFRDELDECSINIVSNSIFDNNIVIGGQGQLYLGAEKNITISNNLFKNDQTVTNHYTISAYARTASYPQNIKIFNNNFQPIHGSGITLVSTKGYEIYNNTFNITSERCTPEYMSLFTSNAIRITDYNYVGNGSFGNKIYDNNFYLLGKYYDNFSCTPIVSGIHESVADGKNYMENNNFYVTNTHNLSHAYAFYIGSSDNSGIYKNNYIKTNDAVAWITNAYGPASNGLFENNTIERFDIPNLKLYTIQCKGYSNFRWGYCCGYIANNFTFINNKYINTNISNDCFYSNYDNPYSFDYKWYVDFNIFSNSGIVEGAEIKAKSILGDEIKSYSDNNGKLRLVLSDYNQSGSMLYYNPTRFYTPKNPYNFTISKAGYNTYSIIININESKILNINLEN